MSSMIDSLMGITALLGIAGALGEFVGANTRNLLVRKALYLSSALFTGVALICLVIARPDVGAVILSMLGLFRVFNAARVLKGRMKEGHAFAVTRRTSMVLLLLQAIALLGWILIGLISPGLSVLMGTYGVVMLLAALVLLGSTERTLHRSRLKLTEKTLSLKDCPTVSVCIPARNETEDLAACLQSVMACTYPKLEVLVLDDCSQDKTSEIIKKFAHDGARFIKGDAPREGWLAKNQAYETLASAANGDLLLFCGVDVRFDPEAIGHLVRLKLARKKTMLSVMPQRAETHFRSGFIQPARYWWEIALPRRLFNRPPVLSTFWLIEARALDGMGGFKAVDNSIVPEAYFARELVKKDGYSFVTTTPNLQISSVKDAAEQKETAIRVRYPQLRKRPESVALLFLTEAGLLLAPFAFAILGIFVDLGLLWWVSLATVLVLEYAHGQIIRAWNPHGWQIGGFAGSVLVDLCLLVISMWQYEFATVTWKDRNICIPVMQVIPRLPQLKD